MILRSCWLVFPVIALLLPATTSAAPPWQSLIPFWRVDAKTDKDYTVTERQGPWMVMAASFAGPEAREQARELVLELRRRSNLEAYIHERSFDFTKPVEGNGFTNTDGNLRRRVMRYRQNVRFDEFAVLVGNFDSVNDSGVAKSLKKIKFLHPTCLDITKGKGTTRRFAGLRDLQRRFHVNKDKQKKGPMGNAFLTRNPLLPDDFFERQAIDPLVLEMNRDVKFSLLRNRGRFTVRVATFRGRSTMKLDEIQRIKNGAKMKSTLADAADRAHRLTMALRKKGHEAYEFHDRYQSLVTVGSFMELGRETAAGIQLTPPIQRIMNTFKGKQRQVPGLAAPTTTSQTIAGVPLDLQPAPIEVPKQSIATAYARQPRR